MMQPSDTIPLEQPQQNRATNTPTQGICATGSQCILLTLYPLAELVQALQGAALTQLGWCLSSLLHSGHRESLLQSHHDLVNLGREQSVNSKFIKETLSCKLFSQRFFMD